MSEKDFDKGYKSGFKFGKEVANEEWLDKVKQAKENIENTDIVSYLEVTNEIECSIKDVRMAKKFATTILDNLIADNLDDNDKDVSLPTNPSFYDKF